MAYVTEGRTRPPRPRRVGIYAGLYVRISDDREGAGLGVKRQETDCRELAERLGWQVVDTYVDNDLSAYTGQPRESYNRLLEDVRTGRVDSILVWHNDRLHRHPIELEQFIKLLEENRVPVQTVKAGEFDLATPTGRLVARQIGSVARYESEHKAERIKAKHVELARAGRSTGGGYRPYGYRRIYDRPDPPHRIVAEVVVPEEATVIREAARRVLAGEAIAAICRDFNTRNITTSGGGVWNARRVRDWAAREPADPVAEEIKARLAADETPRMVARDLNRRAVPAPFPGRWSTPTLTRLLVSARIAGLREHRPRSRAETRRVVIGEITGDGNWPAIITETQSRRLRVLLADEGRRTSPGPTGRHLCAGGVLVCGRCKRRMVGKANGANGRRQYRCDSAPGRDGCGRVSIDADGADDVVAGWVAETLANPDLRAALLRRRGAAAPDEEGLLAVMADCEAELEQLAADHGGRLIGRAEWLAARGPVLARLEDAKRALAAVDTVRVLEDVPAGYAELRAFLLNADKAVSRRRAVVFQVLERVEVESAVRGRRRFDPERLSPQWRI